MKPLLLLLTAYACLLAQSPSTSIIPSVGISSLGVDVCSNHSLAKTFVVINQAAAGPTTLLTGVAGKRWYICYFSVHIGTNGGNVNVNLVEGTGTNCSSVSAGMFGGTTAATGPNLAGTDWMNVGNGTTAVLVTATLGDNVCYISGGTTQVSGALVAVNI